MAISRSGFSNEPCAVLLQMFANARTSVPATPSISQFEGLITVALAKTGFTGSPPTAPAKPVPPPAPPTTTTTTTTTTTAPPPRVTTPTAAPVPATTAPSAACTPISDENTCYEPGEYCRDDDHGITGRAGDGETITCEDNDGWRWEPT